MLPAHRLQTIGQFISRYGLVLLLLWVGCTEFTGPRAESGNRISANSSIPSYIPSLTDARTFAEILGLFEIILAVMIALRPLLPGMSAMGSLLASALFLFTGCVLTTLSWNSIHDVPMLFAAGGRSALTEFVFLGISAWTAGEALLAAKMHCPSVRLTNVAISTESLL